jgi:hypothetical protein
VTMHAIEVRRLRALAAAIAQQGGARNPRRCELDPGHVDPDAEVDVDRLIDSDAFWDDVLGDDEVDRGDDDADDDDPLVA